MSIPLSVVATPPKRFTSTTNNLNSPTKKDHISSKGNNDSSITSQSRRRNSSGLAHKDMYAGAKFSDHPPATELPKPPRHWVYNCKSSEKVIHLKSTQNREK